MCSRLQLDVCNPSLRRRHLVNAYEVKAGIGVITGNTVWSMPERLECEVLQKVRYINTLTFTFVSELVTCASTFYAPAGLPSRCTSRENIDSSTGRSAWRWPQASILSVRASPFMCQHRLVRRRASPFPRKNGIVYRAGKSIIHMLLLGIKWQRAIFQLSGCIQYKNKYNIKNWYRQLSLICECVLNRANSVHTVRPVVVLGKRFCLVRADTAVNSRHGWTETKIHWSRRQ